MIVVWRVTQRCNLTCAFCAWDKSVPGERIELSGERAVRFGKLLAGYQSETGDRVLLSWLGGEPTLWPPLYELASQFKRLGLAQSTTTNGTTLASPRVQALVLENFSELTVSVDGFQDFHDHIRGWPGGFQKIRAAIMQFAAKRASSSALKLRVNVVLIRRNLASFPDLCLALAGWGVDEITFNALGGRDRPEFYPSNSLRPQDTAMLARFLPQLRSDLDAKGVRLCGGAEYVARISATANGERLAGANCRPAKSYLFVNESGKAAPCDFTVGDYGVEVDELRTVEDLRDLPARFAARRHSAPVAACQDCPSTQVFSKFTA
jgi:MoaA/NifB/PqqE/SkfB family radical SAM enzyme